MFSTSAFRLAFISAMPATWLNCAIWATIWVLSIGLNGSWVVSCLVISRRKSFWSIEPTGLDVVGTPISVTVLSRSEERRVGKEWSVRVDLGGRRIIKKKKKNNMK